MLFKFKKDKPILRHVYFVFFILVFLILIGGLIVPFKDQVGSKVSYFLSPFFDLRSKALGGFESFFSISNLKFENNVLREEISLLKTRLLSAKNLEEENEFLRQQIGYTMNEADRLVLAYVSYPDQNPFTEKVILNVGSSAGVKVGDLAINANSLVGKIIKVSLHTSELELINNNSSVFPVVIKSSKDTKGIMRGELADKLLIVNNLLKDTAINIGDSVVLSTDKNYFTNSELLVGRVKQVKVEDNEAYQEVIVEPIIDLVNLKRVFIIT